jgi:uncharacterized repeat protein (TIGR01451 family)
MLRLVTSRADLKELIAMNKYLNKGRRVSAAAAVASVLGTLLMAPTALAESATSPNGSVSVSVAPPVIAGATSTYTLNFTNTTAETLSGIVASGNLPSGMTLKNINGCARLGGNQSLGFLCTMPNLAPGASEAATFGLVASGIGTYDVPFTVSGSEPAPGTNGALQIFGDSVALPVNVQPGPTDIQVTGSSNAGSPTVGSTFNYTFQVKNNGPLPAFDVTLDDPLPASILLGGPITIDNGSCSDIVLANSVQCTISSLAVGQQSNISFAAKPTVAGVFGNTATVAMRAATDTHPANNSVTVTVQPK